MKSILISSLFFLAINLLAQERTFVLSAKMFDENGILPLPDVQEWKFKEGHDTTWAHPAMDDSLWQKPDSALIASSKVSQKGIFEGWFRIRIKLDSSFRGLPIYLFKNNNAATEIYINGKYFHSFGNTSPDKKKYYSNTSSDLPPGFLADPDSELLIAVHFIQLQSSFYKLKGSSVLNLKSFLSLVNQNKYSVIANQIVSSRTFFTTVISILGTLSLLFWLLAFLNKSQKHLIFIAISVTCIGAVPAFNFFRIWIISSKTSNTAILLDVFTSISIAGVIVALPLLISQIFTNRIHRFLKIYGILVPITVILSYSQIAFIRYFQLCFPATSFIICAYYLIAERKKLQGSKWAIAIGLILTMLILALFFILIGYKVIGRNETLNLAFVLSIELILPLSLLIYVAIWLKEMIHDVQEKANRVIQVTEEKKQLLESQNMILETQVNQRTMELTQSLENLKATQSQLIQSEKMASLGELTAGIAHEIQNPLNFVNNFSEVNEELLTEMKEELDKGNIVDAKAIANDAIENQHKILHHGKRADAIVKGMLQHSKSSHGNKEPTDINTLADEYVRLAYHGLRAKDNSFNATLKTEFDENIGKINIIPQDIGKAILNLITNAFYAVNEKSKQGISGYEPTVELSTKKVGNKILICVKDNGNGIPDAIKDKIFQPFFTTKPAGQGTGLGLSLVYDIVKAHGGSITVVSNYSEPGTITVNSKFGPPGGELKAESKEGEGTEFSVILPCL